MMKQLFSTVVFALLFAMAPSLLADAPKGWGTDYDAALARAAKEKRPVLALFTGSDWCPYCVQLEKKVLKDSSFRKFAEKNVVLLYLDFPRKKQLEKKLTEQNKKLAEKYGVKAFPTSLLLDAGGETLGKINARNAHGYIRDIEQLMKKMEKAEKPQKSEKAKKAKK